MEISSVLVALSEEDAKERAGQKPRLLEGVEETWGLVERRMRSHIRLPSHIKLFQGSPANIRLPQHRQISSDTFFQHRVRFGFFFCLLDDMRDPDYYHTILLLVGVVTHGISIWQIRALMLNN